LTWDDFIYDTTKVEIEPQMVAYNLLAVIHNSNLFDIKKFCAEARRLRDSFEFEAPDPELVATSMEHRLKLEAVKRNAEYPSSPQDDRE
jgi:hypothetical protein